MTLFKKSDLKYEDYSWKAKTGDNPKLTGSPDNDLLNRTEGYEMLDFINVLMKEFKFEKIASGQKIERLIREEVPANIHSRKKIKAWINENW
jgi:hypothetical protein